MKTAIVFATILLLAAQVVALDSCAISLDHVDGLYTGDRIPISDNEVTFWLRLTNNIPYGVRGLTNGFEISGSDPSVTWNVTDYWCDPIFEDFFDLGFYVQTFSMDGSGADTIGFSGAIMGVLAMEGYNDVPYRISLQVTDPAAAGHQICLDSAWYPPTGAWMWGYGPIVGSFSPLWDGPHCFDIIGCCTGIRGNINGDPGDQLDIADLVYLVDFMFSGGPAPPCMEEADTDGSGEVDISDLVGLVDFMFNFGFPPADCP